MLGKSLSKKVMGVFMLVTAVSWSASAAERCFNDQASLDKLVNQLSDSNKLEELPYFLRTLPASFRGNYVLKGGKSLPVTVNLKANQSGEITLSSPVGSEVIEKVCVDGKVAKVKAKGKDDIVSLDVEEHGLKHEKFGQLVYIQKKSEIGAISYIQ